jgi:HK97 gp10 family phage protein
VTHKSGLGYTLDWNGDQFLQAVNLATDATLSTVGANIVRDAIGNLTSNNSIATGNLRRSIGQDRPHDEGGRRTVNVGIKSGTAGKAIYALFVEYGRKPGKRPPIDAILPWVLVKHLDSGGLHTGVKTSKRTKASRADRESAARSIAFLIARAIGKRGIKGKPYLKPAYDVNIPEMRTIFAEQLRIHIMRIGL